MAGNTLFPAYFFTCLFIYSPLVAFLHIITIFLELYFQNDYKLSNIL